MRKIWRANRGCGSRACRARLTRFRRTSFLYQVIKAEAHRQPATRRRRRASRARATPRRSSPLPVRGGPCCEILPSRRVDWGHSGPDPPRSSGERTHPIAGRRTPRRPARFIHYPLFPGKVVYGLAFPRFPVAVDGLVALIVQGAGHVDARSPSELAAIDRPSGWRVYPTHG